MTKLLWEFVNNKDVELIFRSRLRNSPKYTPSVVVKVLDKLEKDLGMRVISLEEYKAFREGENIIMTF